MSHFARLHHEVVGVGDLHDSVSLEVWVLPVRPVGDQSWVLGLVGLILQSATGHPPVTEALVAQVAVGDVVQEADPPPVVTHNFRKVVLHLFRAVPASSELGEKMAQTGRRDGLLQSFDSRLAHFAQRGGPKLHLPEQLLGHHRARVHPGFFQPLLEVGVLGQRKQRVVQLSLPCALGLQKGGT